MTYGQLYYSLPEYKQHTFFSSFVTMDNENVGPSIFIGAAYTSSGKIVEIVSLIRPILDH